MTPFVVGDEAVPYSAPRAQTAAERLRHPTGRELNTVSPPSGLIRPQPLRGRDRRYRSWHRPARTSSWSSSISSRRAPVPSAIPTTVELGSMWDPPRSRAGARSNDCILHLGEALGRSQHLEGIILGAHIFGAGFERRSRAARLPRPAPWRWRSRPSAQTSRRHNSRFPITS